MSQSTGRRRTCGQISDSADPTETLGQLFDFRDLARDGWVLDTAALYATLAFSREDVGTDAIMYAEDIRSHLPTDALRVVADQVIAGPDVGRCLSLANHLRGWLLTGDAGKADRKTIAVAEDAIQRLDLYCAAFGNATACSRAAVHAYEHAGREKNPVLVARYAAVALGLLSRAQRLADGGQPLVSMTSAGWLLTSITRLRYVSDAFGEHVAAAKTLAPKGDEPDTVADLLSDMSNADQSWSPDVDVQADLDDLLDAATSGQSAIERQPLPAVMVLQSLSHLPEQKSSSTPNPRLEYASLAGVYVRLAETPDLQAISRTLVAEMPWAEDVITTVLMDSVGSAVSRVRNSLLVGRPGSGKTRLARRIGELMGMEPTIIPAAGAADASFGGTNRQWSSARSSVPLQTIRRTGIANPLLVLDELEKCASGNYNGRLSDVLLPFLEAESARQYHDPFVECAVALHFVGYIATCNSVNVIPGPLLDRLRVIEVPQPRRQDLPVVVRTIMSEIRVERFEDEVWCPDLDLGEMEILAKRWRGGSLRPLRRMIETILAGRMAFTARH